MNATTDRTNNFDLIRLIAAWQVFMMHANYWLKLPVDRNLAEILSALNGVPIFFVISGYLIAGSLLSRPNMREYAIRRAARIYPAMIILMVVVFFLLLTMGIYSLRRSEFLHWVITTATGWFTVANLISSAGDWSGGIPAPYGILWTVAVELQFYLLLPLLIFKVPALWTALIASFFLAVSIIPLRAETSTLMYLLDSSFPTYAWMFLLGAAVRIHWARVKALFVGKALFWIAAYGSYWMACRYLGVSPVPEYKYVSPASTGSLLLLFGAVISSAYTLPKTASVLRGTDLSYGIYLWHMPVICVILYIGAPSSWWIVTSATALLASLSWLMVEKPAIHWSRLVTKRAPTDALAT